MAGGNTGRSCSCQYILPATAIGLVFSFLLAQSGVLNSLLRSAHLGFLAMDWLGSAANVVPTIGGVIVWQQLGFGVVVFAAALLAVPQELIDAARIDGASNWEIQRLILLPYIRRVIEFFMVLEAITVLSSIFAYVFVAPRVVPRVPRASSSTIFSRTGSTTARLGVASAAVVILLMFVSVLIVIYLRLRRPNAEADR